MPPSHSNEGNIEQEYRNLVNAVDCKYQGKSLSEREMLFGKIGTNILP
jgi:hypothetical protein